MPFSRSNEIILVFPGRYRAPEPQVPLSLLHIASPLKQAGFRVRIFDMRLENYLAFDLGSPLFVGISCMSGQQIRYALEFARKVRAEAPACPIVWGGVHPTLLPEQTAQSSLVDVVVRGEGELIVVPLARALAEGQPLDDVAGLSFKDVDGEVKSTPDADVIDLDEIPVDLPFELLKIDRYPTLKAGRVHIQTSRGCPSRCGFCYNTIFNKRRWRGKSAKRVVDEIEHLIKWFPAAKIVDPVDDNFFADKQRVEDICREIINRNVKVAWRANCRFDYLSTYDKDFIDLIEKAGCVELDFGGESGSERLQNLICKDVTYEQILTSVANLHRWGSKIDLFVSWLSGLPDETDEELNATFDLMDRMTAVNPRTQHYGIFVYTPFPSPVLSSLPGEFDPPRTLEEWGDIEVFHFRPPWHSKSRVKKLQVISAVTRYAFYPQGRLNERGIGFRLGYSLMNRLARYRWRKRYFGFPVELMLVNAVARRMRGYL